MAYPQSYLYQTRGISTTHHSPINAIKTSCPSQHEHQANHANETHPADETGRHGSRSSAFGDVVGGHAAEVPAANVGQLALLRQHGGVGTDVGGVGAEGTKVRVAGDVSVWNKSEVVSTMSFLCMFLMGMARCIWVVNIRKGEEVERNIRPIIQHLYRGIEKRLCLVQGLVHHAKLGDPELADVLAVVAYDGADVAGEPVKVAVPVDGDEVDGALAVALVEEILQPFGPDGAARDGGGSQLDAVLGAQRLDLLLPHFGGEVGVQVGAARGLGPVRFVKREHVLNILAGVDHRRHVVQEVGVGGVCVRGAPEHGHELEGGVVLVRGLRLHRVVVVPCQIRVLADPDLVVLRVLLRGDVDETALGRCTLCEGCPYQSREDCEDEGCAGVPHGVGVEADLRCSLEDCPLDVQMHSMTILRNLVRVHDTE